MRPYTPGRAVRLLSDIGGTLSEIGCWATDGALAPPDTGCCAEAVSSSSALRADATNWAANSDGWSFIDFLPNRFVLRQQSASST
jgi:hypothetical protein